MDEILATRNLGYNLRRNFGCVESGLQYGEQFSPISAATENYNIYQKCMKYCLFFYIISFVLKVGVLDSRTPTFSKFWGFGEYMDKNKCGQLYSQR